MRKTILLFALLASFSLAQAQKPTTFEEEYYTMLKKSGVLQIFEELPEVLKKQITKASPNANPEMIKEMGDSLTSSLKDLVITKMIPLYKEKLTIKDVREINKFYDSEVGKKLQSMSSSILSNFPPLMSEWSENLKTTMAKIKDKWNNK